MTIFDSIRYPIPTDSILNWNDYPSDIRIFWYNSRSSPHDLRIAILKDYIMERDVVDDNI